MRSLRRDVLEFAKEEYGTEPERLWKSSPNHEVLRHSGNKKWYAIIMDVKKETLDIDGEGYIDVVNVKLDPTMVDMFRSQSGFRPAYHMNKENWLTILLDGSVDRERIFELLAQSYAITAGRGSKKGN